MANKRIDGLDQKIIASLRENGRKSNRDLAREIGVTEATIRKRIRGLIERGSMHIAALTNPFHLGYNVNMLVGIQAEPAHLEEIAHKIAELRQVRFVSISAGRYNIVAVVLFTSSDDLLDFLTKKLAAIPGIKGVETSQYLKVTKRTYDWVPVSQSGS
ncbi:MAG: Lrp/AsnC family transcriptional regulator [Chloroflexi bacterium]|nr:Lrp/AsnC family transcriptional regulator [Chloroflexota bacterium]MCL5075184.1 Lrp/AsnC family transcriptional regulator [Chloroflexota bacterium]